MEGVEEREGRGQRVRRKSSGFPGVGKQSSRGCAGQSTGQGEAGLQARCRPRWGAGDHRLQLQGRKSPQGAEKNNEGQIQLHPNNPQHPSGRHTHSSSPACRSPPSPGLLLGKTERAGGQLPQSEGANPRSLASAGHLRT